MTATNVAILSFIRSAFLKALFIQARPLQLLDGSHSTNLTTRKVTDLYLMEEDPISSVFVALKCLEHSFCAVMVDVPYLKAKTWLLFPSNFIHLPSPFLLDSIQLNSFCRIKVKAAIRAVVVAQLIERLLLIPEVHSSNPVISKIYIEHLFTCLL